MGKSDSSVGPHSLTSFTGSICFLTCISRNQLYFI